MLIEKFQKTYRLYPKYPVADAGYGSYNNYLYCEEHSMEKYMKFTMFEKETKNIIQIYECESCEGCPYKSECCKSAKRNRTIRINRELTSFHEEVISNLESIHGSLLCMNRASSRKELSAS